MRRSNGDSPKLTVTERYGGKYANTYQSVGGEVKVVRPRTSGRTLWHSPFTTILTILTREIGHFVRAVFLPAGYPNSVTEDYIEYQMWDTLQAFASSITGALATEAVLKGIGVGDETATASAAAVSWMIKDGVGHVGRITFAYCRGTQLDSDSKRWRLAADVLNDLAFLLDLMTPLLPRVYFTPIVCTSSVFRACVGVAGGATRAAITQHQARQNNLADVSAKDGSQETLVNLSALVVSIYLLPMLSGSPYIAWTLIFCLIAFHLYANWRAVTSLQLTSLNRQRLRIALREYITTECERMPSPKWVNAREPVVMAFIDFHSTKVKYGFSVQNVSSIDTASLIDSLSSNGFYVSATDNIVNALWTTDIDSTSMLRSAIAAEITVLVRDGLVDAHCAHGFMSSSGDVAINRLVEAGWAINELLLEAGDWRIDVETYGEESGSKTVRFDDTTVL